MVIVGSLLMFFFIFLSVGLLIILFVIIHYSSSIKQRMSEVERTMYGLESKIEDKIFNDIELKIGELEDSINSIKDEVDINVTNSSLHQINEKLDELKNLIKNS
jgi:uncharacterized protein YoxC